MLVTLPPEPSNRAAGPLEHAAGEIECQAAQPDCQGAAAELDRAAPRARECSRVRYGLAAGQVETAPSATLNVAPI